MNEFVFTGRLVRDVELRTFGENRVTNFTVACDGRKNKDGTRTTDFFDCTAWNGLADTLSKYCNKGDKLLIRGEVHIHEHESATAKDKNGNPLKLRSPRINVNSVEFIGSRSGGNGNKTANTQSSNSYSPSEDDDGDLPF